MKHIFTISLCFLALSLSAQETITYPYNPDGNADGLVAVPDLQDILAVYGNPFSPAEIMVGDTALSEWIQILYQALQDQQELINALQGAGGCNYAFPEGLDGEIVNITIDNESPYTVPENKRLYITYRTNENPLAIDGVEFIERTWFILRQEPIILNSNQEISEYVSTNSALSHIQGILVDEQEGLEGITFHGTSFEVPISKKLFITHISPEGDSELALNNDFIYSNESSIFGFTHPLMFNETDILTGLGDLSFNGYLVDEDYFADCGGGGSVDEESVTTVSIPDNALTELFLTDYSRFIIVDGQSLYTDGVVHFPCCWSDEYNLKEVTLINRTSEILWVDIGTGDSFPIDVESVRDFLIIDGAIYPATDWP
jgi:hypothetical protein